MSCTGKRIVRYCLAMAVATVMCSCASETRVSQPENAKIETGFDGVFFSTANVLDTITVSETAHYVLYDDIDAALDCEMIRLTPKTYKAVCQAIASHKPFVGTLKATCPYETVEYAVDELEPLVCADIDVVIEDEEVPL